MNAGRFVIDGLAIPANGNAQRYREYPIGPAPGAVGLARSLFSYSNPGGGGRLARGVRGSAARLRVVRAHSQNYRPWRHIERTPCTPCWSSCCARPVACVVRPPPPPLRFRKFRSVEELETTPFIRSTCNDVVGLCSVSRLGCPIKQGKEGSVFGVEYSEQLRKKERKTLVDGYDSAVTR